MLSIIHGDDDDEDFCYDFYDDIKAEYATITDECDARW